MSEITANETVTVDGRSVTTTTTVTVTTVEYPATVEGERARLRDALVRALEGYRASYPTEYREALYIIGRVFVAPADEAVSAE